MGVMGQEHFYHRDIYTYTVTLRICNCTLVVIWFTTLWTMSVRSVVSMKTTTVAVAKANLMMPTSVNE